jgi:8-oxo-dGTP diphosphatase
MKRISAGIIYQSDKILACQRKSGSYYELKWEFPGGKVEENENAIECLIRELKEELDIIPLIEELFYVQKFKYPDGFEFEVFFYKITEFTGEIKNKVFEQIRWVALNELSSLDFLEADKQVIELLERRI